MPSTSGIGPVAGIYGEEGDLVLPFHNPLLPQMLGQKQCRDEYRTRKLQRPGSVISAEEHYEPCYLHPGPGGLDVEPARHGHFSEIRPPLG